MKNISSKNVISADNQQERLRIESWIVGFVDGEGCFSISLIKNKTTKSGWQVFPEFVITQGKKSLPALDLCKSYFDCGNIFINNRNDNHREPLYRYCVRSINELESKIIPFFSRYQLQTAKKSDFMIFSKVIKLMKKEIHKTENGMKNIAKLIEQMNTQKKSRFLKSPETKRQTSIKNG